MEKRQSKRYLKVVSVRFGTEGLCSHVGSTYDLSENGILLKSNRTFPPLTKLTLELSIPSQTIYCEGYVQWAKQVPPALIRAVKKLGMGILLTHIAPEYRQFIYQLGHNKERRMVDRSPIPLRVG